jgi:inorganic triphosphatase YgiF
MEVEVELKFSASGPEPLDLLSLASSLGPAALGPARTVDERDRYLDTRDGRLAAVRWACRLRTREGHTFVSLKGPIESDGRVDRDGLHRRPELEGAATASLDPRQWPASPARRRLLRMTGGQPLIERLVLEQQRCERAVTIGGRHTGLLSLDRVRVIRENAELGRLCVVELELRDGSPESDLVPLAEALGRLDGLLPDPTTKLERALAMRATASHG